MDETTYKDPAVIALLQSKYILVRVDQDSRPDLSNRYEDYGWPATVVFNADGGELVKRQGYIPPRAMASMLKAIIDDPSPGPSVTPETAVEVPAHPLLIAGLRDQLQKAYIAQYDFKKGGWGFDQKYLDWDSVEYAISRHPRMARQTLTAQLNLLDPAWGGVYQYSTDGDWKHPHFEKIMAMQAENLRVFAQGWQVWRDPAYLHAAQEIHRFLVTFLLSPEGAFYTSQDADLVAGQHSAAYFRLDDKGRRKLGVPRVDTHVYARENGWAIHAFVILYEATGEQRYLEEARRATDWIVKNRSVPNGGFRHDEGNAAVYLGDTLAMSRAFVSLYTATGDREWLRRAEAGLKFIAANFRESRGVGFVTAKTARPQRDENATLARVSNLAFVYTGNREYRDMAKTAMLYVASPSIARRFPVATALLTDAQLAVPPLHLTIVGPKDGTTARTLFATAIQAPVAYKVVEWWDSREGPLPNPEIQFPQLKRAAAFVCTDRSCSPPIYDAEKLRAKIAGATLSINPNKTPAPNRNLHPNRAPD